MAVSYHTYAALCEYLLSGFSMNGFTPTVALFTDQYVPDLDNDRVFWDMPSHEPTSDPQYVSATVSTMGYHHDAAAKSVIVDVSGSASFNITASVRYALVYDSYQGYLVGLVDFGENITGQIDIQFPDGLIVLTRS